MCTRAILVVQLNSLYGCYIFDRGAISAKSLVRQLGVVIEDVPRLFIINVEDKEEAYFSSLIASSKYKLVYQQKILVTTTVHLYTKLHFRER